MLTYEQINDIVIDELNHIGMWDCEVLYTDLDMYEECLWILGREPNCTELYASTQVAFGEICGQCFAGQLGELMRNKCHDTVMQLYGAHMGTIVEELNFGYVWYYIDNIVRTLQSFLLTPGVSSKDDSQNERVLRRLVRATVAHERRHSVQPSSMYEEMDWRSITEEEYYSAAHEADAREFELAVFFGKDHTADINNPAAWHPERLVA